VEQLEPRLAPALIASQIAPALTAPTLTPAQVSVLLQRAAAATSSDDAIVAVVDRAGNILGVRVEGNVSPTITGDPATLDFAIDGAVAEARGAALFSSDAAPITSRTVGFISQSTITQREVQSTPYITDPSSPLSGPGLVAAVGTGGHFPPGINDTPPVDLFEIELTNRDGRVNASGLPYGIDPANVIGGTAIPVPGKSYAETIADPVFGMTSSRGVGTLPGGIPLYDQGELVGAIGVFFPGKTGFATEENSSLSATFDPTKPDLTLEAEFIALAAAGGSSGAGFPVGTLAGVPPLPGFDLPFDRIDLNGVTLNGVGPGGTQGPENLVTYADTHLAVGQGDPNSGTTEPVVPGGLPAPAGATPLSAFKTGTAVPAGWLVLPHAGVNITAAQVEQMIQQGINQANQVRSQLRLPLGSTARMIFAVTDSTGAILGLYRMPDAPVFSIDVAIAKARNTAYYDDPAQLQPVDQVPGLPAGIAMTNRTFRFLAQPRFAEGANGTPPAPFSILNGPGVDTQTGLNVGPPLPASAYDGTVLGFVAFHPNANFHAMTAPAFQNGVVFFPGSSPVFLSPTGNPFIVGGFGVSGDGVNQDDLVTVGGIAGFAAPPPLAADQFLFNSVRLPYFIFPRNPFDL
jgi:uncharacterized protein GlcG (DUF336 family)